MPTTLANLAIFASAADVSTDIESMADSNSEPDFAFQARPPALIVLCCKRVGAPPDFALLPDRRMRWLPGAASDADSTIQGDYFCHGCGRHFAYDTTVRSLISTEYCSVHGACVPMIDTATSIVHDVCFRNWQRDVPELEDRCATMVIFSAYGGTDIDNSQIARDLASSHHEVADAAATINLLSGSDSGSSLT